MDVFHVFQIVQMVRNRAKDQNCFINLNPFLANVPILYPLKISESQKLSGVFMAYKIGTLSRNG